VVEGLLNAAAIPFQDLQECEKDLRNAEISFTAGAAALAQHKFKDAVTYWATGLDGVALGVQQCGLAAELKYIQQEAAILGFANVTALSNIATILVHGSDVYDEIFKAFQAFSSHDYRTAGANIGTVMNQLSNWTKGHSCTSDFCYVVTGMMQFLGDIQGDIKACKTDFETGFHNFTAAFKELTGKDPNATGSFPFTTDKSRIKTGIGELGYGLKDVAAGVSDCHLQEFADILEKLAVKLGVAPEIEIVEEVLKIIIEGVQIETEVGDACLDYSQGNWVGFGYNLMKLVKTLA